MVTSFTKHKKLAKKHWGWVGIRDGVHFRNVEMNILLKDSSGNLKKAIQQEYLNSHQKYNAQGLRLLMALIVPKLSEIAVVF